MAQQYDVSPEFRKLFERKQQQRMEFRAHYLKEFLNPYRQATNEGGYIFDPAIHRYHAMHAYSHEHFRPNKRNFKYLWWVLLFPVLANYKLASWERDPYIEKVQTGQIAYKDRRWKAKL